MNEGQIIGLVFIAFLLASLTYRVIRSKPILFFSVSGASYLERGASGEEAHRCLVIAIRSGRLSVRPSFPFTLLFLPELYRLEFDIPLGDIVWVQPLPARGRFNLQIRIREAAHGERIYRLRLIDPQAFLRHLPEVTVLPFQAD